MLKSESTIISYAQNAEDVVLFRALSNHETGFYIDIGAWHPVNDSVTKLFYDRGWSGINIEPQPDRCEVFKDYRPRDINLQLAVSNHSNQISLWVPQYSALATCEIELLDERIPDYRDATEHRVQAISLGELLEQYAKGREIHFLKIDVEGHENTILLETSFTMYRPIVLVIEATCPHTNKPKWHEWEPRILQSGYQFALFDGLNRFYVREESSEILANLSVPSNCLDGYITQRENVLLNELERVRYELKCLSQ